jgi:hypothetical protein
MGLAAAALAWSALAAPAAPAMAGEAGAPIASLTAETPISAGAGWLVWSVRAPGGWVLDGYHEGVVTQLPIAPRPQPFDAGVGIDQHGNPVVVFSRCTRTPSVESLGEQPQTPGGALLQPGTGRGCRLRIATLPGGHERILPVPYRPGASDTTPSIWNGSVAFARHAPGHGDVWQLYSWNPRRPRVLVSLPHGRIPTHCEGPRGCASAPAHGEVQALSRDGALVTFVWRVEAPGVEGLGTWEVRVDRVGGSDALIEGGFAHEACNSPLPPHTLEYRWPEPPIAVGTHALLPELEAFSCFESFGSVVRAHGSSPGRGEEAALALPVLGLAAEGPRRFAVVPGPTPPLRDSPGCSVRVPCTLEQVEVPALTRAAELPFLPFP